MSIILVISLVLIVTFSARFLRATGKELVQDQERASQEIVEQSVKALEEQGEAHLEMVLRDRATRLDAAFEEIASIVNLLASSAERLQEAPEEAKDVALVSTEAFRSKTTRPADFGRRREEPEGVARQRALARRAEGGARGDERTARVAARRRRDDARALRGEPALRLDLPRHRRRSVHRLSVG